MSPRFRVDPYSEEAEPIIDAYSDAFEEGAEEYRDRSLVVIEAA